VQVDLLIDFLASPTASEARKDQADLIISHGVTKPEGMVAQSIFNDILVPVCSPAYLRSHGPLCNPLDLKSAALLHSRYRPQDWGEWFSSLGIDFDRKPGLVFSGSSLLYQAAKEGIGVAMGQYRLLE
jgi:LysR family glycine cleavage system transcriptional activator